MWDAPESAMAVTVIAGEKLACCINMATGSSSIFAVSCGWVGRRVIGANTGTVGASIGPSLAWPYEHPLSLAEAVLFGSSMAAYAW